ncbi:MAG TPA: glycosyltransferase [Terriglobales bacterium]|nr:glycosyltransferase [Terriglobales bacterium]
MPSVLILFAAIAFCVWLYLFFGRGFFWRVDIATADEDLPQTRPALVAVVVPARNEAAVVARSISSLLNQQGSLSVRIFLVDDDSSDDTAEIARSAAALTTRADRLSVISGKPLPPGWSGKLWAMDQGVAAAKAINPDFLLLTDADIEHGPSSLATLCSVADSGCFDLVSLMVKLYCRSFAERALMPAFVYFFFQLYPPRWIRNPKRKTAAAAGGSILVRPEALERAGGISAIRTEIIDDCALARAVKRSGGRVWLGLTNEARSVRPYGSFAEIGRMVSRNAFNQLQHSTPLLIATLAGMVLVYLLPPAIVLFSRNVPAELVAGLAWLMMTASFLPMVRFYRLTPAWSLAVPLIAVFYMGASFHSAFRYWTGQGGEWKGRNQDPPKKS